jgi:mono/diheme cytochrome c family protein
MTPRLSVGRSALAALVTLAAWCVALLIASSSAGPAGPVRAQGPDLGTDAQRESGKKLYMKFCSQCHGDNGDGEGYATPHLSPRPRNFTTGKYKIRTTPTGALPTHQDLINIIRRGMPFTSMPAWPSLTDQEVSDLAYFIKTFSPEFAKPEAAAQAMSMPSPPNVTKESVELGKKLYEETGCVKCHGTLGRGDGPSAPTLKDDWGQPIRPADLTQSWTFRGGGTREDIFRSMSTGLNGTPMPGFGDDALKPEQRWAITDFVDSLSGSSGGRANYSNLIVAKHVPDPIDLAKGAASFANATPSRLPIVGQIMEPGRSFYPPATSATVQAIHDGESIAVLVRWNDMTADKTAKNGLTLPVPPEEEEGGSAAAGQAAPAAGAQPDDPFADPAASAAAPVAEFSDAVAIQIPSQVPTSARKPYFIFGDTQNPVDLWFFDLARPTPLQFTGKGSADITANDTGDVTGVASYDQGEWSAIFKRAVRPAAGPRFTQGEFMPIALSVWDGLSRERGNRRGLTLWYSLYVEPEIVPSAAGPMAKTALSILAIELAIIWWVRRRYGARAPSAAKV